MTSQFDENYIEEDCVDCTENAKKLMAEIDEGLDLMEKLQAGSTEGINPQNIMENNIVTIYDGNDIVAAVPELMVEHLKKTYEQSGISTKKWVYTRVFRQAEQFVENLNEQRERVNEQNRNLNPEPTPEQPGLFEEGDSLSEEGLFRVDLNEDLLRQHQELCSELRQDSDSGDSAG